MRTGSLIAVYFVVWWITLFVVLPFGVKNSHEAGQEVPKGFEPGAPVAPHLVKKALVNTVIAAIVTAGIWWAAKQGWL